MTTKQQRILDFIQREQRTKGVTPTFQEIADEFGFRSLNFVTEHVRLIRQKGQIESARGKARSLRVTSPLAKLRSRIVDIPLFGSIPAGHCLPLKLLRTDLEKGDCAESFLVVAMSLNPEGRCDCLI